MRCSKCGTETAVIDGYTCMQCGRWTCLEHRMPDRHDCYSDDPLKGIEVKSLLDRRPEEGRAATEDQSSVRTSGAGRASAAKPSGKAGQPTQPAQPQKRKRFGIF